MSNTWTKESIRELLAKNDKAVGRALLVLLSRQTRDEKDTESTRHHNKIGFTPYDARMMTSMARFYAKRGFLSHKQLAYLRAPTKRFESRIGKYAGQLLDEIEKKEAA